MSLRTLPALKQAVYTRLTNPPISYQINTQAPITLTAKNVSPRPIWTPGVGGQPMPVSPYIAFSIGGKAHDVLIAERDLTMKIWVSSNSINAPDDEVSEVYEAVRALLHGADDDVDAFETFPPPTLSQAATATTLPLTVRRCREEHAFPVDFEPASARWYISATYRIVAL
jgi:hypothetical protein